MTIASDVHAFIVENFLFGDTSRPIAGGESLIDADLIDSTGVLELVAFLEQRFGITVADSDIVPANLDSIDAISAYVASRGGAASQAA